MRESLGDAAGLAVTFRFGEEAAVCLMPESLPLPSWYRQPSADQQNQLQTLADEWAERLFPPELIPEETASVATASLQQQLDRLAPGDAPGVLEVRLTAPEASEPSGSMFVVWPLSNPVLTSVAPFPEEGSAGPDAVDSGQEPLDAESSEPPGASENGGDTVSDGSVPESNPGPAGAARHRNRVLQVPVSVTVRIASKKLDLSQLRNITPGTLITFNKSCESLLDVFVGSKLKFRGEAVKVGERFGVKINEPQAQVVREQRVHRI